MPRTARVVIPNQQAVYHVISRTALNDFPMGAVENDFLLKLIKRFSRLYFTQIMGFCLMGNHFHLLVRMLPESDFSDDDIGKRLKAYYGKDYKLSEGRLPYVRTKLGNLSEFIRDIKVNFTRFYNRRHNRRGYFWGDRFKSVIVDRGETLVNCLAYIDLNPLRAGIVHQPEKYRWSSIGYHLQTNNKDRFLSTDFGLKEFNVRRYRRYMYVEEKHKNERDKPWPPLLKYLPKFIIENAGANLKQSLFVFQSEIDQSLGKIKKQPLIPK